MKRLLVVQLIILSGVFSSLDAYSQPDLSTFRGPGKMDLVLQLSEETQSLLRSSMEEFREVNEPLFDEIAAAKSNLKNILSAPEFDQEAFNSEAMNMQELHSVLMAEKMQMFGEVAVQLSQEEREILVQLIPGKQDFHSNNF